METILKVVDLKKWFQIRKSFLSGVFSKKQILLHAVDGISFEIKRGEIFGLAGESGSGKTTTGRLLLRLTEPTSGEICFKERNIATFSDKEMKRLRRNIQMIFQDPYGSLNPRKTVKSIVREPLSVQRIGTEAERERKVEEVLEAMELTPVQEFVYRFPHELSGGQRQRVAAARAFVLDPEFVVADEPVSMLDVSIRSGILDLILDFAGKRKISFLYITHDLALARHICDRLAIMYLGKIMEIADGDEIVYNPLHPYTKALISAVPVPDPSSIRSETAIKGEIPNPISPPPGCRFHTRCPMFLGDICRSKQPRTIEAGKGHLVACHLYS